MSPNLHRRLVVMFVRINSLAQCQCHSYLRLRTWPNWPMGGEGGFGSHSPIDHACEPERVCLFTVILAEQKNEALLMSDFFWLGLRRFRSVGRRTKLGPNVGPSLSSQILSIDTWSETKEPSTSRGGNEHGTMSGNRLLAPNRSHHAASIIHP
jgi:hypothetical protein